MVREKIVPFDDDLHTRVDASGEIVDTDVVELVDELGPSTWAAPAESESGWTPPSFVMEAPSPVVEVEPPPAAPPAPVAEPAAATAPAATPRADRRGRILAVFGCRGGSGATTLAVNMAGLMARAGKEVCLVDLDLQLGDVFMALDLTPTVSLSSIARDAASLDGAALKRRLQRHASGVYVLAQTGKLDEVAPDLGERLPQLLQTLAQHFDAVIVDGLRDFGEHALAALDAADDVMLLFTQDVAGIQRVQRVVELCTRLGYPQTKLRPVLNRYSARSRFKTPEIERALGTQLAAQLRNDFKATQRAQDSGELLADCAPRAAVHKDVSALVDRLLAEEMPAARAGLFSRFLGKKR
jgi:pilus assembly protein CpaE